MNKRRSSIAHKISALLSAVFIFAYSFTPYIQQPALAQEATDSAQVAQEAVTPTPAPHSETPKNTETSKENAPDVKGVQTQSPSASDDVTTSSVTKALTDSSPTQTESSSRLKRVTTFHQLSKKTYKLSEPISVQVEKDPENDLTATMLGADGKRVELSLQETFRNNSSGTIAIIPPREITPGAYTLELEDSQGEKTSYDIVWGVLAINTNKSVYRQHEKAQLAIAVLDEKGEMVCDADVKLTIINPKGESQELSTKKGDIEITNVCTKKLFTMEPDYKAEYQTSGEGDYQMELTAKTKNGTYEISDSFGVSDSAPFDVERSAPTRTYPVNSYPVTLTVTASEDFKGTVTDVVPYGFDISEQEQQFSDGGIVKYNRVETGNEARSQNAAVLGASTSSIVLQKPFEGDHPVTLGYGQKYHTEGLVDTISKALKLNGHEGVDFDMPKGTSVLAAAEGKVIVAGEHDYGLTVTIQHDWGKTYYGHLSDVLVKVGDGVQAGQEIAKSGNSGESTGPHLHFGMKPDDGDAHNGYEGMVDPMSYLPVSGESVLGASTTAPNMVKNIMWNVDVKKGETVKLGYQFISPPQSPRLYLLGKARFESDNKVLFEEKRQWQLAVDSLSTVVDGTSSLGTSFPGQRKIVRTTYGANSKRTFVVGVRAAGIISLYYTDDPDTATPSWTTVGDVSSSLYESVDMEWDSTNDVLYLVYGRNTPVDANTSDIKYRRVTALTTTPVLGTERDALAASNTLNYTHPLVTIAQDSGTTKVFVFATGRTDAANPARISLRTGTINSDNPTWDTLYNVKSWTAAANAGNVSLSRLNTDKTILFYYDGTNLLATRHDDADDAQATTGWDALDGTNNSKTTVSADDPGGGLLGSAVGATSTNVIWFAWLDSGNDINTRRWNGSSLDTEMTPVALAATTVGPSLSLSADNATLYMSYQQASDATILVYQTRSATDGTTAWGGSETTIEDHSETLTYPSAVERLTGTKYDVTYTTATTFLIRHSQVINPSYTISGTVKGTNESSFIGNPPCDGSTAVVSLSVNGSTASTTTCNSSTGAYSFSNVAAFAGDTIYVYLNSSSTPKANMVMVSDEVTHSDVDLYSGVVIVRDDQDGTITSADMNDYDNDQDATNMLYDAETSGTYVDTDASSELHVWTGDTFAPGGPVTISGSIHNAGTMTWSTNTTTFDATNSGNYLSGTLNGSSGFYKVTFNGSGGEWTIQDPMLVSAANATDTFAISAGTVTLGNGGGDNLDVRGKFTISASAVFQTMSGLAQGDNTVCNSDDICVDINANSSPPSCANCIVANSGTLTVNKNATIRLNSNTRAESGIQTASTGFLKVLGTQDDTDNSGIDSQAHDAGSTITLSDASQSWTTNEHQYKHLRITNSSSLAYGRIYQISSNAANTVTIPDNNNTEDTGASISGSGNSRTITSSVSLITADNEGVGQYIYNSTDDTYFLIIDSTNNGSTDTFKIAANPSSFPSSLTSKTIKVDDGVRAADTFEILDFAAAAGSSTTYGHIIQSSGSETVLKYSEISYMGDRTEPPTTTNAYGIDFESTNGSNSSEGVSVTYSYLHDDHRTIRFNAASNINRSYTVQGEPQGILYNYIKDATQDGVNASSGSGADIIGNRIQTVSGNKDCIVVWTGARNQIVDNIVTTCDPGIYMDISGGNYVVNNKVYNSSGAGISALTASSKNLISGNSVFSTAGAGINLAGGSATTTVLVGNTVDVAASVALDQANTVASTIIAANESYGNYVGNTTADVRYAAAAHTSRFYNSKFGSSTETSGITTTNAYLESLKHDQTSGASSIWNDFTVPAAVAETPQAEETAKFNYADNLFEDSFTPSMFSGGSATVDTLDFAFSGGTLGGSASQYAYFTRCKAATSCTSWDVYRDGVDIGDASNGSTFTDNTTNVQFKIDAGITPYDRGDVYLFAVYQDSADTSTQKTTTMVDDGATFTVGSSTSVQLLGSSSSTPSTFQKGGTTGYTMTVSGGTFNGNYFKYTGLDSSAGLSLTSGTITNFGGGFFDAAANTGGASDRYVTIAAAILNAGPATFSDMTFDDGAADTGLEDNVRLSAQPSACTNFWTFYGSGNLGGATNGEANDNEPVAETCNSNQGYLLWADTPTGPTTDQQMRHGMWFSSGVKQSFTF